MPTFLSISRHSPENCPLYNEEKRKANLAGLNTLDAWQKKYGVKLVGAWSVPNEHLNFMVFEAPSLEAFQASMMDPTIMAMSAGETTEIKVAMNLEEINRMLRQTK